MKTKSKAYIAGIIDGDGHLGITKHPRYSPAIQFVNESRPLMNWAVHHFGGTFRIEPIPSGKLFHRWILYGKEAQRSFIDDIYPYLFVKKSQADILRQFLELNRSDYNPECRELLFQAIRKARTLSSVETDTQNNLDNKSFCAYAAGLLDTDGHIGFRTVKSGKQLGMIRTRIEVVNIYLPVLKVLQKDFGGYVLKKGTTTEGWKQRYRWIITDRRNQERFLLATLPYMIVKKQKANLLLEYIRHQSSLKIQPDPVGDYGRELAGTLDS